MFFFSTVVDVKSWLTSITLSEFRTKQLRAKSFGQKRWLSDELDVEDAG